MRKTLAVAAGAALALVAGGAIAEAGPAGHHFRAHETGAQERPTAGSKTASGDATLTLSSTHKSLAYRITTKGLSGQVLAAHIHLGRTGQAGGVLITLINKPTAGPTFKGRVSAKN